MLSRPCHDWLRARNCAVFSATPIILCSLFNIWVRRLRKRGQKSVQIPVPLPPALLCHLPCRGAHSCHPQEPLQEVLPGPRGVNSQADTVPASQLKRFCRWSVCPIGPVAQEKNHLIIFYFFLILTPNHCNTREQMPGNSEAAVRSRRVLRAEPSHLCEPSASWPH